MKLSSITDVTPSKLLYYKSLDYYYTSLSGGTYLLFRLQSWKKGRIFAKEKWKFYELKFIKNEMHFFFTKTVSCPKMPIWHFWIPAWLFFSQMPSYYYQVIWISFNFSCMFLHPKYFSNLNYNCYNLRE